MEKSNNEINSNEVPHIVILGGGFAGISAAKQLAKAPVRITLVDKENHHLFQPLLYQVATAGLSAADIAEPLRHIFANQKNLTTVMDEVVDIDVDSKEVKLGKDTLSYDYLIVALGASTGYFGNDQWTQHAPGLKTLDEATELRRRILLAFERAEIAKTKEEVSRWMNFVVIGGGPTGVELAGAVAELARHVFAEEYRNVDTTQATIHLIEAGPRLMPAFKEKQSDYTARRLEKMGVTVHLNTKVSDILADRVVAGDQSFEVGTVLWAAGVKGNAVAQKMKSPELDRAGRVIINTDLNIPENPNVFVVGDLAHLKDARGKTVPGLAPAAMQMGKHAAKQILCDLKGKKRRPFVYFDKGNMATIGRSSAIAEVGKIAIRGYPAWLAWLFVHLLFLIGLRNRISVFIQWVWSYIAWHRGARIITKKLPSDDSKS
jgi:NADH dehydrogenase